ncbi:WD repeat-containing protein 74 [Selaginella moellendorffii]|nr:WD repeat-containing protein 74 [Selaginella moellendorffii]|eukprot:XP_024539483.1 WD repeat-containing protein 74 [Selaginella moellendorffii]
MPRTSTLEPPGCPAQLRAICCDALGFVKVVEARGENGAENGPLDVVARWGQPGAGISAISYSNSSNRLAVARKSGDIEILESTDGSICAQLASLNLDAKERENDAISGLHLFREDGPCGQSVLSCSRNGDAALRTFGDEDAPSPVSRWNVCKSGEVLSMRVHNSENVASFGGNRVELSLWDLESSSKVWEAKKPRPNNIGLVSLPYVTASTFLLRDDHRKLVIGTGDYQVRLYDVHAQKRPVVAVTFKESPIKAVAEDPDGFTVYVGNSTGSMASFDMRTGKLLSGFKGKLAGSVRCIARHPSLPLIASCGLDRFLRIHDIRSRQLLGRIFLKQPLVAVVFDDQAKTSEEPLLTASQEQSQGKRKQIENEVDYMDKEDDEYEEEKPRKKKPKKHKKPKRKQAGKDDEATDLAEDESPAKKLKELKKLKRKQNGETSEPKKKKIKDTTSEKPKEKSNEKSTNKKKRTREE